MIGKYTNRISFNLVRLKRILFCTIIRNLVRWKPLDNTKNGYTIIIGCNSVLAEMLVANVRMLEQQKLSNLYSIIIIFDRPKEEMLTAIESRMRKAYPNLPLEFIYYSTIQSRILSILKFPWANAWLSWCVGIANMTTQYGFLHDFDAMLLRKNIIEERYEAIRNSGEQYIGSRYYQGNGIISEDKLLVTFELMFDAAFIRDNFKPLDLFNHVKIYNNRSVDFDTFLYAQSIKGTGSKLSISEEDMVHPSQMICQFSFLLNNPKYIPPSGNNLLLIPYFLYLAGNNDPIKKQTLLLQTAKGVTISLFGRQMNLMKLTETHSRWIAKQAYRLEKALYGEVRPEVRKYFDTIYSFVANSHN